MGGDKRFAKFVWSKPTVKVDEKTKKESTTVDLYALKSNKDNTAPLSGGVIVDARDTFDQMGKPAVSMQMNGAGANVWEKLTSNAYTQKDLLLLH